MANCLIAENYLNRMRTRASSSARPCSRFGLPVSSLWVVLRSMLAAGIAAGAFLGGSSELCGQPPKEKAVAIKDIKAPPDDRAGLKRLSPDSAVWLDSKNKHVVVDGEVCLTKGFLEMFACPKETKEHESVVAVNAKAYLVHAGLLALGAKQGKPVQFDPEYVPARGEQVDVICFWTDKDGKKHKAAAQDWVRNVKTKKAMTYPWVFAGSDFWLDENTGKRHYLADAGDFICVSNFPSAMLDVPVKSSQDNDNLLFEAFTENIPPRGTKVTLVLVPHLERPATKTSESKPQKR